MITDLNWIKTHHSQKATPSWKASGDGRKSVDFEIYPTQQDVLIVATEYGEKSSKTVHVIIPFDKLAAFVEDVRNARARTGK